SGDRAGRAVTAEALHRGHIVTTPGPAPQHRLNQLPCRVRAFRTQAHSPLDCETDRMAGELRRADRFQRRHGWLGFPAAVAVKFVEDQAGRLSALIAYYAFLSVFPLLLVLTTILGFVLAGNPELVDRVMSSALGEFPIISRKNTPTPLTGSPFAL